MPGLGIFIRLCRWPSALHCQKHWLVYLDEADTSLSSIEAQDADVSIDSMGGAAISQQRDIYGGKDRKEVDFVITKVLDDYR